MSIGRCVVVAMVVVGAAVVPRVAHAQDTDPASPPATSPGRDDKLDEARQRYQRGLQLFNEGNFGAAVVEFERAFQLAPSYKILYNIGLCYEQLGDYVQALTILQRYLEQGGTDINEQRRSEVAKELAQIRPRIARVTVRTNVAGADLLVDDGCATEANSRNVQCGPFDGQSRIVFMNPGRRRVTLRHEGYLPETQLITVAGSDLTEMIINLKPLPKPVVEKKSNPYLLPMWIGFGVTGGGIIAAGVTGVLAGNAADKQTAAVDRLGATRGEIDELRDKTRTLATATDAILIGTAVTAAASTYFLIRALRWRGDSAAVVVGLGGAGVSGRF